MTLDWSRIFAFFVFQEQVVSKGYAKKYTVFLFSYCHTVISRLLNFWRQRCGVYSREGVYSSNYGTVTADVNANVLKPVPHAAFIFPRTSKKVNVIGW
jgi:hypothetical protein